MRRFQGSRRIVVQDVEYRWRARGEDGFISIGIGPASEMGPYISGNVRYYETWVDNGQGIWSSLGDQLVVTNRLVRRIIEHAITELHYDPRVKGKAFSLRGLDEVIELEDAVRARRRRRPTGPPAESSES